MATLEQYTFSNADPLTPELTATVGNLLVQHAPLNVLRALALALVEQGYTDDPEGPWQYSLLAEHTVRTLHGLAVMHDITADGQAG
jgi:hypothetical protein